MGKLVLYSILILQNCVYHSRVNTTKTPHSELKEKTQKVETTAPSASTLNTPAINTTNETLAINATHKTPTIEVRKTIKEMVKTYCPSTDICDDNASNAELEPNGAGVTGLISCCTACSCHADCKERMNCCFPDSLEADQDSSVGYECLHTRIGHEDDVNANVPAFRTVVKGPEVGCVDSRPVRLAANIALIPTCDDTDVTPLGSYFPVYSRETGEVYKNILCARCHGITKTVSFRSFLVCKGKRRTTLFSSITEFLGFFESKSLSTKCHVDFIPTNASAVRDKRCYNNVIDTCAANNITIRSAKTRIVTILGAELIRKLCKSGFNSPTVDEMTGLVYKNVFCSQCGRRQDVPSFCQAENYDRTPADGSIVFLLDTKLMHTIGKDATPTQRQEVCLSQHTSEAQKYCRTLHCPSGRVRHGNGDCVLVGNFLNTNIRNLMVKLTPKESDNLTGQHETAERTNFVEHILESNPWPKDWKLTTITVRNDDTVCSERAIAIVSLDWKGEYPKAMYQEIDISIKLPWILSLRNKTVTLSQSFLEYNLKRSRLMKLVPSWQVNGIGETNLENSTDNYFNCELIEWEVLLYDPLVNRLNINKPYFCDQIQLENNEFVLGDARSTLKSNLTKRILHDLEFDLIEGVQGELQARVCLDDSLFSENKTSHGDSFENQAVAVVIAAISLSWYF